MVRGLLLRLVRDEALADDLVQEALLRAMQASGTMRGDASPSTWLAAIAINLARDHFRSAKRAPATALLDEAGEVPAPVRIESEILQTEMSGCILGHIHRLPERQREAVLMYYFAGLGHRGIAAALEISEGNARIIVHRGLATLRESLGRECVLDFKDEVPCERR